MTAIDAPTAAETTLRTGRILHAADARLRVRLPEGTECRARRAAGCLVAPAVGDEVLLAAAGDGRAFVLAVLVRESGEPLRLAVEGDAALEASGTLRLSGAAGLALATGGALEAGADALAMRARAATLSAEEAELTGGRVTATAGHLRLFAEACDMALGRLTQRLRTLFRRVEETEDVQAGFLSLMADKILQLRGGVTTVKAKENVKVEGRQVHIG
jgi:hypothetical protein